MYKNWKDSNEWPKILNEPDILKQEINRQKDPFEKDNIVGAFCRVYDIHSTINLFLKDIYAQGDSDDKYTYVNGSVANGATVYGNGKWLYSFHATDPASRMLCNSFDLVRIHKFGHLDEEAKEGTPTNRLPSYVEMCQIAMSDKVVRAEFEKKQLEIAKSEFSVSLDTPEGPEIASQNVEWRMQIARSKSTGLIDRTINNALLILENAEEFKNKIVYDRFSNRFLIQSSLPWSRKDEHYPRLWSDSDDAELRGHFEKYYEGFKGASVINDALAILKNRRSVNVARDYFEFLKWDGVPRLDNLVIDYLGAENTEYVRQVTRKAFTAVVARAITELPIKFDNMVILTRSSRNRKKYTT